MNPPDPITAASAAAAAHEELQKAPYQRARPGLLTRILKAIAHWLSRAGHVTVNETGTLGVVVILLIIAAVVVLVVVRLGRLPGRDPLAKKAGVGSRRRSAQDYRDEADSLAAQGEFAEAVRATTRAMVRELEERGVLEPVPGSTAAALSAQAARAVPAVGGDAAVVSGTFDRTWYAGVPATAADAAGVRAAELRVKSARLVMS